MPFARLRLTRFNTSKDLNQLMWELTCAPASDRRRLWAMVDQLNGVAEDYLKECGNLEELACGYGIGARQLRRWMWAYMEGGIDGLLQRRSGRRGRKRKMSGAQFFDQVLSTIEEQIGKADRDLTAKEAYQWAREHLNRTRGGSQRSRLNNGASRVTQPTETKPAALIRETMECGHGIVAKS